MAYINNFKSTPPPPPPPNMPCIPITNDHYSPDVFPRGVVPKWRVSWLLRTPPEAALRCSVVGVDILRRGVPGSAGSGCGDSDDVGCNVSSITFSLWICTRMVWKRIDYRQTSNISHTLVGNKIVDHSDVVGASPVGAAPTTSSFST